MMKTRTYATAASLLIVLLFSACAAAASGSGGGNRDELTREEIAAVDVSTLYEVVQRLRPRWLAVRSQRSLGGAATSIVVYQGQSFLGGVDALRQLGPDAAAWLQYLDGATASATLPGLGSRSVEGAIVIHTTARGQ